MDLTEKIAYLKGLMEGMEIDKDSKEGKIYAAMMDILTDMALTIEDMADYVDELSEQVDKLCLGGLRDLLGLGFEKSVRIFALEGFSADAVGEHQGCKHECY